jgi:PPM family protein phosphatase
MEELLPIGEFSARCGLSAKMLRTYAAAGLLTPAAVDRESGYRYYSPAQERDARLIGLLRRAGVPLGEVAVFLRDPTADRLEQWEGQLDDDLAVRREALAAARTHIATATPVSLPAAPGHRAAERGECEMERFTAGSVTDRGSVRPTNQDAVLVDDRVFVVADGTGAGGEVASAVAVETLCAAYGADRTRSGLASASRRAARAVWRRAEAGDEPPMGSTLAAVAVVSEDWLAAVNVGDSRVYRFSDGALHRLTRDHTVVEDLVSAGAISAEQARRHPERSILTRILGIGPDVEPNVVDVSYTAGDRLLLCTDGLFNEIDDHEISEVLSTVAGPEAAAVQLVRRATDGGASDNVSVIVVDVA